MYFGHSLPLHSRQEQRQVALRNHGGFMGETQALFHPSRAWLHQNHPQTHRAKGGDVPQHRGEDQSASNYPHERQLKFRVLRDHVRGAAAYRIRHPPHGGQAVLRKGLQVLLLQIRLAFLHQGAEGQDSWRISQRVQPRRPAQRTQRLRLRRRHRNGKEISQNPNGYRFAVA